MSKQEHDQDEKRAPSGAGKGEAPGSAPKKPATDKAAAAGSGTDKKTPKDDNEGKQGANKPVTATPTKPGDEKPASSGNAKSGPDTAKAGSDASSKNPASKQDTVTGQDKSTAGNKSGSTQDNKPGAAAKPKDNNAQGRPSAGSSASPAASSSGAGGAGVSAAKPAGRDGSGGGGSKAGIVALILVILLALAAAAAGWWAWQKISAQQAQLSQLSRVENNSNAISQLESRLESLRSERDQEQEQALQGMRNEMQQYREQVNQTLDRVLAELASEQETDPGEWLYAEVEYLLRLANQRLQLERDVAGAKSLLRTADERLAQADNPALTPVRRAIQSELGALNSVPSVDRTGLYLQLMAQQEQLAKLPLQQDIEQIAAQGGDTTTVEGAWKQQVSRLWQELKELVVVRRHDQALEALMTPQQESYLRQNVRLQLEQAQLALLEANPELYQASLEKATTLIEGYYDPESGGVQEVLETLRSLTDRTIRPELPDISGSLQALRDFMARRQDGGGEGE